MIKLFYATKNKSKIYNMQVRLKNSEILLITPYDLNIDLDVEEDGINETENALKKARAYYEITKLPTIAGDTSLYISGLTNDKQPGLKVRRINGSYMNDDEMLDYYVNLLESLGGKSEAYYTTALALKTDAGEYTIKINEDKRILTIDRGPIPNKISDPLDIISIDPKTNKYYTMLTENDLTSNLVFGKKCIEFIETNLINESK